MDSLTTFRRRLKWTSSWLDTLSTSQITTTDEFELILHPVEDITSSDFGVESLADDCSTQSIADPSGGAAYYRRLYTCTCHEHSCHKCRYRPGSCVAVCMFCTKSRFAFEGRPYCQECNGDCSNDEPKIYPDDLSDVHMAFAANHKELNAYEFTNREATNEFRDLRSASKARKRKRRESEKYFHYKAVKPGWLGQPFYSAPDLGQPWTCFCGILLQDAPVETMTKKMMFQEAQRYPRPPTYHHRPIDKIRNPFFGRRGWRRFDGRKHARHHLEVDVSTAAQKQISILGS